MIFQKGESKTMKHSRKVLPLLMSALLLATAAATACTGSEDPAADTTDTTAPSTRKETSASTDPTTEAATEGVTDPVTEAVTEAATEAVTDEETEPAPELKSFTVTVDGDTAHVTTPTGLTYDLTGYDSIDVTTAAVTFSGALTVTMTDDALNAKFNRFTMDYSSDQPLQIALSVGTSEKDTYFLEASESDSAAFSAVVPCFLDGQYRRKLTAMSVTACTGVPATFSLADLAIEEIDAPADATCFLENDRLKLGIALHWGGTISYFEDKSCAVDGLTNLVNRHDTGRLIQQSYYGTIGEGNDYEPAMSFGSLWHYNPVQGGDQYGVGGRIIDFRITENSIYIKSQPCDWAKQGAYTPFYTENTYTLEEDYVRVDNRAVDFSGYEHPYHFQEIPAMYVVSYLDTFACYNGDSPWTGGDLSVYRDLPFWSHGRQIVYFNEQNTETWYAWYSEEDNFGIGVYVPGLDTVGGGRNEPEIRDKSDVGGSSSFGGGANILRMKAYQPFEYSYLLTAGSMESIRETFAENKDFAENPDLDEDCLPQEKPYSPTTLEEVLNLDLSKNPNSLITLQNSSAAYDEAEDALKLTTTSGDVGIYVKYNILRDDPFYAVENPDVGNVILRAKDYTTLRIEYMIPTTNSSSAYNAELYPCAGDLQNPEAAALMWISGLAADGQYHTLEIDLTKSPYWNGDIHQIRFDFFNSSAIGDVMYVKSITLQ